MYRFLIVTGLGQLATIWGAVERATSQERLGIAKADLAALICANAMLALGPLFVRLADVGPVAAAFWRMAIALPILLLLAGAMSRVPLRMSRGMAIAIVLSGILFATDLAAWHLGILRTKLVNANLFGNSASLMFPLYGFIAAQAWPSRHQSLALVLAAAGAGLLLGRSYQMSPEHLFGDLLCLLAGLFYTLYFVMIAKVRASMAPLPLLAISTLASAPPLLLLAGLLGERIVPTDWTPLLALALGSQVIGQGLLTYVLGRVSPLVIGLGLLTQPVVGASIGWMVYGERLGLYDFLGAVLVAMALVIVSQPDRRTAKPIGS